MRVSVIIPTYNEEDFVSGVISDLAAQDFPKDDMEVLIVDGRSSDRTREIIESEARTYAWLMLLDNPHRVVPNAMNIGIRTSRGQTIIRMDAHCRYPSNYIFRLLEVQEETRADNVGGVWITVPGADTAMARAIALATSHPFGIGNASYRLENKEVKEVDTVPYGCYPREVFERIGMYDEDLVRNQDDELNGRLIQAGGKIVLIPDLEIEYSARPTWKKMNKMFYQYGLYKPLVNKKLGRPATWRQFIPPAFVVVGLLLVLSVFITQDVWIQMVLALVYVTAALGIALSAALHESRPSMVFLMPITFALIHLSYGLGYWRGIWQFMIRGNSHINTVPSR
ncbi:MAG: glycosyltransferase family 2 protein [Flavobacteriales bacterium]|nr:glycosyltransferase family 2 protein [Flavobacteriales bacterium]